MHTLRPEPRQSTHHRGHAPRACTSPSRLAFSRPRASHRAHARVPNPSHAAHVLLPSGVARARSNARGRAHVDASSSSSLAARGVARGRAPRGVARARRPATGAVTTTARGAARDVAMRVDARARCASPRATTTGDITSRRARERGRTRARRADAMRGRAMRACAETIGAMRRGATRAERGAIGRWLISSRDDDRSAGATRERANALETRPRTYANASRAFGASRTVEQWSELAERGVDVNPCNSPKHPAALAGVQTAFDAGRTRRSLQEAYDPYCIDFVCGRAHDTAGKIGLVSYRCENEENVLESHLKFPSQYEEFPGIIGPAMYGVAASAHGNWAASIALMDRAILPRPPLVAVKSLAVSVVDLVGPGEPLTLRSRLLEVEDAREPFRVVVEIEIKSKATSKVVARAECSYEKIGAVRSMR